MRKGKMVLIIAVITLACAGGCNNGKAAVPANAVSAGTAPAGAVQSGNENAYSPLAPKSGVIEIREKMFMAQVNDMYLNAKDYLGKSIKLEGIFMVEQYEKFGPYFYVVRFGPGCCGNDGNVGFEVKWDKEIAKPYPDSNAWVEATGVLQYYHENFVQYLYLNLSSLNVLDKRGVEYVNQ